MDPGECPTWPTVYTVGCSFVAKPQDAVVSISELKKISKLYCWRLYCCKIVLYQILFSKLCDSYILYCISLLTVTRCNSGPKN